MITCLEIVIGSKSRSSHVYVSGWPRPCPGDVSAIYRLRVYAPHLGKVQQSLDRDNRLESDIMYLFS